MSKLDIIMYHYVRSINYTSYKKLKFLNLSSFRKQLDFFRDNFNILDPSILINKQKKIPNKSCILTFDDGYKDHIDFVLPELKKRKLKGIFFPTGITTFENKMLDTNLIQHILSVCKSKKKLKNEIKILCNKNKISDKLFNEKYHLYSRNPNSNSKSPRNRYDDPDIIFIKRLLQFGLKKSLRKNIINTLFNRYIKTSQTQFSKNFYMNDNDIKKLLDEEMLIGSHTYNHVWLGYLSKKEQEKEIKMSLDFLNYFQISDKNWVMCYPYGSYNNDTLKLLKKYNCSSALTTKSAKANLNIKDMIYELPRRDTNDFKNF